MQHNVVMGGSCDPASDGGDCYSSSQFAFDLAEEARSN